METKNRKINGSYYQAKMIVENEALGRNNPIPIPKKEKKKENPRTPNKFYPRKDLGKP